MYQILITTLFLSFSLSANAQLFPEFLGQLKCSWNSNEENCFQNGCLWDKAGCQGFDSDFTEYLSSSDLALSVMRQRLFSHRTTLFERNAWIFIRFDKTGWSVYGEGILYESLSQLYSLYGSDSFTSITKDMNHRTAEDPTFPFAKLAPYQQAMNFYPLLAPKTAKATILYRGLRTRKSCLDQIKEPRRFISTSWTKDKAVDFVSGKEKCLLEIELPEGFPFFSMNGSDPQGEHGKSHENEIFLPSHVLDTQGNLVPISFEVLSKRVEGKLQVFTVKPVDVMRPKNSSLQAHKEFEERYAERVCELAPRFENSALLRMCAATKEAMNLPLTSGEDFVLHSGVTGNHSNYCHDCKLSGTSFVCKCGEHDAVTLTNFASCTTKQFDYKEGALHCVSENVDKQEL